MDRIILYYKFVPIADPEAVRLWQRALADKLNLKGRIIIAEHGINGTLGGNAEDLKAYIKQTKTYPAFKVMAFKWSDGKQSDFPRLSVKVRSEIVTFGAEERIKVNDQGIIGAGKHVSPKQVHDLIKKKGKNVIFFDGRNAHEAAIGKFKNAVIADVHHTRDFPKELKSKKYDAIKNKAVVTYCTGGVRCEVLSMLMLQEGFKEVYQIDGGIVKYGESYGDQGLWEGALYVFDKRIATKFSAEAKDIGQCVHCQKRTSNYENCRIKSCNDLVLMCSPCATKHDSLCKNHQKALARLT